MTAPLQRRITLIRHAKAEDDGVTPDHARALNPRGIADAAALGEELKAAGALPELVICSTATRTRQTLAAMALGLPTLLNDKAYLASAGELLALLQSTDDAVRHVAILAHNPGLHQLAAMLVENYAHPEDEDKLMLKFPTSACAVLSTELASWRDLAPHVAKLESFTFKQNA